MKKPNFFIIGAPKCGTTSLATWLSEHPNVYMSEIKEPHHFNLDEKHIVVKGRSQYESLFSQSTNEHIAIGEASVWYLHSKVAVKNIEDYTNRSAKYIVCIRNPVEMAPSLHEQQVVNGNEHVIKFEDAWQLNDCRLKGKEVTKWCREPRHLAYGEACKLGSQIQRLYDLVPAQRIHVVIMDEMRGSSRKSYQEVLKFLSLPSDGREEFPVMNPAKKRRSMVMRRAVQVLGRLKKNLRIKKRMGFLAAIDKRNICYRDRPPLSQDMKKKLINYFFDEIVLLESQLNCDLSHWLEKDADHDVEKFSNVVKY